MQGIGATRRRYIILSIIAVVSIAVLVLIDQLFKLYFKTNFNLHEEKPFIEGFMYFTYYFNEGAAFGMLAGKQLFFKILTVVALVMFIIFMIYVIKNNYIWAFISMILIISGTIGNFIDRMLFNGVVDFLRLIFFGWDFAIVNIADIFMTFGVIMIIIHLLFLDKNALFKKNGKENISDNGKAQ